METKVICPVIYLVDDQVVTTSLNVAEVFGKQHKDVLEAIRSIDVPEEFNERNFPLVEYTDAKGEKRPMYNLTRDGFTLLVMGFTGRRAMQFKLAYIEAFNRMEAALTQRAAACARSAGNQESPDGSDVWQLIRRAHRGIKLSIRVKLLEVVCQIFRLDGGQHSSDEIYRKYAQLCASMKDAADLPLQVAGQENVARFVEACCVLSAELSVSKQDLWQAWQEFAGEEGLPALDRGLFFKNLYMIVSARLTRPRTMQPRNGGRREWWLCGLALAGGAIEA